MVLAKAVACDRWGRALAASRLACKPEPDPTGSSRAIRIQAGDQSRGGRELVRVETSASRLKIFFAFDCGRPLALLFPALQLLNPLPGVVTLGVHPGHPAIDIACMPGAPVRAAHASAMASYAVFFADDAAIGLERIEAADAAEAEAMALELHSDAQVHAVDGALMTEENRSGCWRIG